MRSALETRDRRVRCASSGGDVLLGQPQLEASLAQVRGDWIGLAQLADPRVLVPRRPVLLAARSATGCGVNRISSDRAVVLSRDSRISLSVLVSHGSRDRGGSGRADACARGDVGASGAPRRRSSTPIAHRASARRSGRAGLPLSDAGPDGAGAARYATVVVRRFAYA